MGRDPQGDGGATCKMRHCLHRFESCPCHTTSEPGQTRLRARSPTPTRSRSGVAPAGPTCRWSSGASSGSGQARGAAGGLRRRRRPERRNLTRNDIMNNDADLMITAAGLWSGNCAAPRRRPAGSGGVDRDLIATSAVPPGSTGPAWSWMAEPRLSVDLGGNSGPVVVPGAGTPEMVRIEDTTMGSWPPPAPSSGRCRPCSCGRRSSRRRRPGSSGGPSCSVLL